MRSNKSPGLFQETKTNEIILDHKKISFDKIVGILNFLMLQDAHTPKEKVRPLRNAEDLQKRIQKATSSFLSCKKIFANHDGIKPFIGHKTNQNLYCNKLVIGLVGKYFSYRVDWDPDKGLHINLKTTEDVKFAILTEASSLRFNPPTSLRAESNFLKSDIGQFIKFKFWFKMTMGYEESLDEKSKMLNYFIISPPENMDLICVLKESCYTHGYNPEYSGIDLAELHTDNDLLKALHDKHLRDVLLNIFINQFIQNCYLVDSPTTNSEQYSELTPKNLSM